MALSSLSESAPRAAWMKSPVRENFLVQSFIQLSFRFGTVLRICFELSLHWLFYCFPISLASFTVERCCKKNAFSTLRGHRLFMCSPASRVCAGWRHGSLFAKARLRCCSSPLPGTRQTMFRELFWMEIKSSDFSFISLFLFIKRKTILDNIMPQTPLSESLKSCKCSDVQQAASEGFLYTFESFRAIQGSLRAHHEAFRVQVLELSQGDLENRLRNHRLPTERLEGSKSFCTHSDLWRLRFAAKCPFLSAIVELRGGNPECVDAIYINHSKLHDRMEEILTFMNLKLPVFVFLKFTRFFPTHARLRLKNIPTAIMEFRNAIQVKLEGAKVVQTHDFIAGSARLKFTFANHTQSLLRFTMRHRASPAPAIVPFYDDEVSLAPP